MHRLRPAADADVAAIADVWHAAWHDGHAPHVPSALLEHRELDHFRGLAPALIARSFVAEDEQGVVGFVTVSDDELELLFVGDSVRGTGVAAGLLAAGEARIAAAHDTAWLEVVTENARARRFYERQGWHDRGARDGVIGTPSGTVVVPYHRYEKRVRA